MYTKKEKEMTLSHKKLLFLSCLTLSLHAMEPQQEKQNLLALYTKSRLILDNYDPAKEETIKALINILPEIKEHETTIGSFALAQQPSSKDQLLSLIPSGMKQHRNGPAYVTMFVTRLALYNSHLIAKCLVCPTFKEFDAVINPEKIINIIEKAKSVGFNFDAPTVRTNADIAGFTELKDDINKMLSMHHNDILEFTKLAYSNQK